MVEGIEKVKDSKRVGGERREEGESVETMFHQPPSFLQACLVNQAVRGIGLF